MKRKIGVVGSINTDLVCQSDVLPKVGETVTGTNFVIVNGGKGANEAVACARLGASTHLIACVGDDMFSRNAIANLQQEGVHITAVKILMAIRDTLKREWKRKITISSANSWKRICPILITFRFRPQQQESLQLW